MPTLYPTSIRSMTGLSGVVGDIDDDPSSPDGSWLTSGDPGVTISWTAPTLNTDGSALTGDDAIDRYRVSWYVDGYFVNSTVTEATSVVVSLPAGDYDFYVTAIAVDGEESDPYLVGTKVVS